MRRFMLFLLLLLVAMNYQLPTVSAYDVVVLSFPGTKAEHAVLIKQADTNDTALSATTRSWTNAEANAVDIADTVSDITVMVYFYGDGAGAGSPASASCHLSISIANLYGGLEDIFDCNVAGGTAQLSHNPVTGLQIRSGIPDPNYTWGDEWTGLVTPRPTAAVSLISSAGGIGSANLSKVFGKKIEATVTELTGATSVYVIMYGG